eukprot:381673_1
MSSFCSVFYKSHLFFSRNSIGYVVEQIILSVFSIIIILLCYYWMYSRQQHKNKGNIDKANSSFLRIYRNIIMIYIIIMTTQFILLLVYIFLIDITERVPLNGIFDKLIYSLIYMLP